MHGWFVNIVAPVYVYMTDIIVYNRSFSNNIFPYTKMFLSYREGFACFSHELCGNIGKNIRGNASLGAMSVILISLF
jgi:hypothetical protein